MNGAATTTSTPRPPHLSSTPSHGSGVRCGSVNQANILLQRQLRLIWALMCQYQGLHGLRIGGFA
eukprot:4810444-Alexandrium_andersonii.AAC.1